MRSALGRNSFRSNISINQNLPSTNRMTASHSISNDPKFNPSEELAAYPKIAEHWRPKDRSLKAGLYQGEYKGAKKWGLGSFWYENGDFFHGNWENDKHHGEGVYYFWNKDAPDQPNVYTGTFDHGTFHGFGKIFKLISPKQAAWVYQGSWRNGKKEGQGKQYYGLDENTHYTGSWVQNEHHGLGVLTFPGGEYDGMWENGRMHGQGKLVLKNNGMTTVYTGTWNDNQLKAGKIAYFDGSNREIGIYTGQIRDYERHGRGSYASGDFRYEGFFQADQPVGQGSFSGKNSLQTWSLNGDFQKLNDLETEITYANQDSFRGLSEIRGNRVYRTKGKYTFQNGEGVEGRFDDNELGQMKGDLKFLQ